MKKLTLEIFIDRVDYIHNYFYNYSKFDYVNNLIKGCIICPIHGEFWQTPNRHLNGHGCPKCGMNKNKISITKSLNRFIEDGNIKFDYKFDYSKFIYINNKIKGCIICPVHGEYWQTPNAHLSSITGCRKCGIELKSNKLSMGLNEFIKRSIIIFGDVFDYSKVVYVNNSTPVEIICKKHNYSFFTTPNNHLSKTSGCPICCESKGEMKIRKILEKINIDFIYQKRFKKCRNKNPLPFDFYIPSKNLLIEYDGIQHFKENHFKNTKEDFFLIQKHDKIKNDFCLKNNIDLLRISYLDFNNIETILNKKCLI